MKGTRSFKKVAGAILAAVVVVALVAIPAVAVARGGFGAPAQGVATRAGNGSGSGSGGGEAFGTCTAPAVTPAPVDSDAPADTAVADAADPVSLAADLAFMREEEKLAHDVYTALYEKWGLRVFSNIAASEQRHTDAIAVLIDRYGYADPVDGNGAGVFEDATLQALYDELVAKGLTSVSDALAVGVLIEETDIADLQARIAHTTEADVRSVYENLLSGSYNHLDAFTGDGAGRRAATPR